MYHTSTLRNSLRVVTHDIPDRDSIAIGFWVSVGGRYEQGRLKGAAHFLEHIVFKGSKQYTCEGIKERIEGVGGSLNAFTSEEHTCFYAKIPAKHFNQTFDVLADMVFFPLIKPNDVQSEKTVIVEEIKMYHDLPQYFVNELLDELIWEDHPLGYNLAGTPGTVTGMTDGDLKQFHTTHYAPNNIVVSVCGNVNHTKVLTLTRKKLGGLLKVEGNDYLKAEHFSLKPRVKFCRKNIEQTHLILGMPGVDENHKDRFALSLLSVILGGNMSSRLFVEVREKRGLAYSISSCSKMLHDTGVFTVRAGVDHCKVVNAFELILKELKKIKRYGVSENEFTRARDYVLGQMLLGLEDTMEHMLWIGESVSIKGKPKSLKSIVQKFNKVKKDDIQRTAGEFLDENRFNLAMVGPVTDRQQKQIGGLLGV